MNDQLSIAPREPSSMTEAGRWRTCCTLPPEQLAKARSRLAFLTLVFAGMCVAALAINRFLEEFYVQDIYPVYIFNGVTSALLFGLARNRRLSDGIVLNLGLLYEILMCLSVSMGFIFAQYQTTGTPPGVTWVCIVLVVFPLIIPTAPLRTLFAAILAAATVPLGLFILASFDLVTPRSFDYVDVSISPVFCVFLAVMGSRVIYGLNVEVARARQMGSYQLVELLGHGGMGDVWRAKHRLLARPAAVKLIRTEIQASHVPADNKRVLERFRREAQVTAGLESPHTVSLYDFGITDDGVFYYVMELLDGLDLETLVLKYGPLPSERAVHILIQICHSLEEAHNQGLVHRDIKPANLVLCCRRAIDYDVVKVLDFGLVALRPETHRADARLTVEGQMSGTPAYMAPETVTEERVDSRADIYALGCVAYWLLTGQLVFDETTPMKTALAHVNQDPVVPSQRTEIKIPAELERLILACLEKERGKRPQNAGDLADGLRSCGLTATWTQERAREWWGLHQPISAQRSSVDATSGSQEQT